MVRDKVRIRFRKGDDLRFISHHDLMRCFERMLRRAALPVHCSEGYNPKPRLVFALSLALGVVGCHEVVEIELDDETDPDEICRRLAREAPPGLVFLSARRVDRKARAAVRRASYRLPIPTSQVAALRARIDSVLAAEHCWLERSKPEARKLDARPLIADLRISADFLEFDLRITPSGMARPEEILGLLGLRSLLDEGAVIERTALDLEDEWSSEEVPPSAVPQGKGASLPTSVTNAETV